MAFPNLQKQEIYDVADRVRGTLVHLYALWRVYRKLFRGNKDIQPILAQAGGELFWLLERAIRAAALQRFRQFTDPPESAGQPNASFYGLLKAASAAGYADVVDLLEIVDDIAAKSIVRGHVNKYVAHLDLNLYAGRTEPPEPLEIADFEDALTACKRFMDEYMERLFGESPYDYEAKAEPLSVQADRVVELLRLGLERRDA
ncbi:MAG: hypothetical protein ACSLE8_00690 [Rhodococcus sp. (in: high G+C Gram-positive bacteria)]